MSHRRLSIVMQASNIYDEWHIQILPASYKLVKAIHKLKDDFEEQIEAK